MSAPLVEVQAVTLAYPGRRRLPWLPAQRIRVVEGVSFEIEAGQTLGLVGESGSGKSTIGQMLLGNLSPVAGAARIDEWSIGALGAKPPFAYRRIVQMVWQNPYASLTPTMRVGDLIAEPMRYEPALQPAQRRARVHSLLEEVGLRTGDADRFPHEFSGGQRQRIAIARALALKPRLIILDEPVSALDVLTQSQILRLHEDVQRRTGVAYLLISHDIAVVRYLAQRIVVLQSGRVVESGDCEHICARPMQPYTRKLIGAVLQPATMQV